MTHTPEGVYEKVWVVIVLMMVYTREKIRKWSTSVVIMNQQDEVDITSMEEESGGHFQETLGGIRDYEGCGP